MKVNWSQGFFRLWLVISLLWIIPVGALVATATIRSVWPAEKPATLAVAELTADKKCAVFSKDTRAKLEALKCKLDEYDEDRRHLTPEERAAEAEWRDANRRREQLLSKPIDWVPRSLAFVFGPPLFLLLPGLLAAWIGCGFTRNSN